MSHHLIRCTKILIRIILGAALFFFVAVLTQPALGNSESSLRLVPFPKNVTFTSGRFKIPNQLYISVSDTPAALQAADDLAREFSRISHTICRVHGDSRRWRLEVRREGERVKVRVPAFDDCPEAYALAIRDTCAAATARDERGLLWAIQTLRQLVRANMSGGALPCLDITDYPSLAYRGFQDDITRGPSSTLAALSREVGLASLLKMNFFTYYLEHQFEFHKHPEIGPKGGSLTPEDLKMLVAYSRQFGVDIIGCQQSFGHLYHILKHERYASLRETPNILNPTTEETYCLLDDLYSEQAPLLDSPLFNVCCDETFGLGTGPSKSLADSLGVGGLYARHIERIHDILTRKYGKRMMMWGDMLLANPEVLNQIPKDVVILSWGYAPQDSYRVNIEPFVKAGFEFFVCPGIANWGLIIPDFETAAVNIRNYVRDGVQFGAKGMLNTTWADDGEMLLGLNWYGVAWGAECAWNGSSTSLEDFNKRIGAVLFGEKNDDFGKAIELLGKTHRLIGYNGMTNARFWQADTGEIPADKDSILRQADALIVLVDPALKHLQQAKRTACINADILDYYIFAAERMKLIATRQKDFVAAAEAYRQAVSGSATSSDVESLVEKAVELVTGIQERHVSLRKKYEVLWNRERRPYGLEAVTTRFDECANRYGKIAAALQSALDAVRVGRPLPEPAEISLGLAELGI